MDPDAYFTDELPDEARALMETAGRAIDRVRKKAERESETIRKEADVRIAALRQAADEKVRERQEKLAAELRPLQQAYAREGLLDEALAIRARIRELRSSVSGVQPGPAVLECRPEDVGKSFLFDVTGSAAGELWGTDVYTSDSYLARAAVHAGVLKPGERSVVKVTVLDTSDRDEFEGSRRNGVTSHSWDLWEFGFTVSGP